jgi:dTDP-4-amino-4,6-dideoxygalactose transaminase
MAVGFYNFKELHNPALQEEILEKFKKIVSTNAFVEGEYNTKFEKEFAQYIQAKNCLLVANGTDALEIGLQAYDIKPGDKVAISAISFFATVECVINQGATPVFVDVDPQTGLICPDSLDRMINKHPDIKAVIPVHIYGLPAPIEKIQPLCDAKGIAIVEDGAQSHGGKYENGKMIGSSANLVTYSFYPTKNLGAFGDAGAITAPDNKMAEKIMSIRNHGRSPEGHKLFGRNSRCDHLQAAVLHTKFQNFPTQNEQRKEVAKKYFEKLKDLPIEMVPEKYLDISSWHLFPIRLANKEEKYALKEHLGKKQIGSALFYEKSMPEEIPCGDFQGEKENALEFAARTLCIPMNPFITDEEIKEVFKEIKSFFN